MRAYLIVPPGSAGPSAEDLAGATDALVFDGSDPATCAAIEALRRKPNPPPLLVRVGGLESPGFESRLGAIVAACPDAVILPVAHGRDVAHLGALLAVQEAEHGLPDGAVGIVALVACAGGALSAGSLVGASPRLRAIGWDADALAEALGASSPSAAEGWIAPLMQARSLVRLAAAAAGVAAVEAAHARDGDAFRAILAAARRDGFAAMLARDSFQAALIRAGT